MSKSLTSQLFRAARVSADISAIVSGNPARIVRRAKNKTVGRGLAKAGVFKALWR